jgi:hypothetical protein
MGNEAIHEPSTCVDLTGLPEPVQQQVRQIVREARRKQADEAAKRTAGQLPGVIGLFAHLGIATPSLDEFADARRELAANFPRDIPDAPP